MKREKSAASIAVIGCGYWGKNLVRNFARLGALRMVCDLTPQGRQAARELAPQAEIVDSPAKVFASDIEGIVIATPAETHHALGRQALEAGKDLLCEKPLSLTCEDGADLVKTAAALKRILMVGHVLEYHPGIIRLSELIRGNELGKIYYIYSNRLSLGKIRREENILWSFAPHDIAVILRLVGSLPFQVVACGGSYLQPNVADVTVTQLLFDNGVRAHIYVSWLHPFKEQRLVVVGSKKMASFNDVDKQLILYDQHVELKDRELVPVKGQGQAIAYAEDEPLLLECQAFLEAIASRQPPITDGASALKALRVLDAAQRSLMTNGQPVSLPVEALA